LLPKGLGFAQGCRGPLPPPGALLPKAAAPRQLSCPVSCYQGFWELCSLSPLIIFGSFAPSYKKEGVGGWGLGVGGWGSGVGGRGSLPEGSIPADGKKAGGPPPPGGGAGFARVFRGRKESKAFPPPPRSFASLLIPPKPPPQGGPPCKTAKPFREVGKRSFPSSA
jgi:hypothetical protein